MPLIDAAAVQAIGIAASLPPAAVTRWLEAADAKIVAAGGAHYDANTPLVQTLYERAKFVPLYRRASSISSVTEGGVAVDAADYELRYGRHLHKVSGALWTPNVVVTYLPINDSAGRTKLELDLVTLYAAYDATAVFSDGNVSTTNRVMAREEARLINAYFNDILVA